MLSRVARILLLVLMVAPNVRAQDVPRLHHVGLNSVDPDRAIEWYLKLWPAAQSTTYAGMPAVQADMLLIFNKVDTPPAGAWRDDLHRAEQQSAFWHIGVNTNTTNVAERLAKIGVTHLPLYVRPNDTTHVWRAGLSPYAGTLTAKQLDTATSAPPRDGGFSYVVGPDGVLFELVGTPATRDAFSHLHFFHEQPVCASNWYVEMLGMQLITPRAGGTCAVPNAEPSWPSLERIGTIRQPSGGVRFGNGAMSWYPRQCIADRCGTDQKLVPSRGQVLDHVAFSVADFYNVLARLRANGVKILREPYDFADTRAVMIEDLDGLSIELIDGHETGGGGAVNAASSSHALAAGPRRNRH